MIFFEVYRLKALLDKAYRVLVTPSVGQVIYAIAVIWVYESFFRIKYVEQKTDGTVIMSDRPGKS
jgi:hypothetical protein